MPKLAYSNLGNGPQLQRRVCWPLPNLESQRWLLEVKQAHCCCWRPFLIIVFFFSYPAFMRDYCKRTCGLCPLVPSSSLLTSENPNPIVVVASKCFDADKRCPAWAAYANQCKTNRLFMAKTCKKSCGLCSGFSGDQPMLASVGSSISHFSLVLLLYIVLPCLLPL